jgi:hypothetical protein
MRTLINLLIALAPSIGFAQDLCETPASIHEHAIYCDQNWDFVPPAKACVQDFANQVSAEQARLQQMLNARLQAAKDPAQEAHFDANGKMLADSLSEVNYLLDFGKEVHTELEDYVYALTPPIFSDEDRGNPYDPDVKARWMESSECYSDPVHLVENYEAQIRPWIDQLEKTKAQLTAMAGATSSRDAHLDGSTQNLNTSHAAGGANIKANVGKNTNHGSTITGAIHDDKLPKK